MIYLDNNATTAIDPRVAQVIHEVLLAGPANPSSQHAGGQSARNRIHQAVETIGRCLGSPLDRPGGARLLLTSGGTESNNLALTGIARGGPIVASRVEHPSVIATVQALATRGQSIRWLEVDSLGQVRLDQLESLLDPSGQRAALVSIMSANNETGVIQPIQQAAEICARAGVPLHVDATQTVAKLPFDLQSLGASAVTFTAHKFHGPAGVGGLWLAPGVKVDPLLFGGGQQLQSRPGTESVALIVGMAAALRLAVEELDPAVRRMQTLRDRLESELLNRHDQIVIQGGSTDRLPGTTSLSFLGTDRQSMLIALDLAGIACSSGAACSSGSSPPSHVLTAMGCRDAEIESTLRFGVSKFSTEQEIDDSIDRISNVYNRLRRK